MSTTIGLTLEPLDVLFFRDGRPFGAATRGRSDLPQPQTLAGAIWTALLDAHRCDFPTLAAALQQGHSLAAAHGKARCPEWIAKLRVRGPWLARTGAEDSSGGRRFEVLVPVPAVLHRVKAEAEDGAGLLPRLRPLPAGRLPGWHETGNDEQQELRPLWLTRREATEPLTGFLTPRGLRRFLADEDVPGTEVLAPDELFAFDHRTGIGIEPDRLSAQTGIIYEASFLALKRDLKQRQEVLLYAEVVLPEDSGAGALVGLQTIPFGGEGRRVRVERVAPWPWHQYERLPRGDQRPLVLLTTPGFFAGRWKPHRLNASLVAAAVPGALAVSGWDLARGGPKPNRFAAQAGSTYFLDQPLDPWPGTLSDRPRDQQQGWGCYLKGVWTACS
jgi:CRISPR-associated protein Cmr3